MTKEFISILTDTIYVSHPVEQIINKHSLARLILCRFVQYVFWARHWLFFYYEFPIVLDRQQLKKKNIVY